MYPERVWTHQNRLMTGHPKALGALWRSSMCQVSEVTVTGGALGHLQGTVWTSEPIHCHAPGSTLGVGVHT